MKIMNINLAQEIGLNAIPSIKLLVAELENRIICNVFFCPIFLKSVTGAYVFILAPLAEPLKSQIQNGG